MIGLGKQTSGIYLILDTDPMPVHFRAIYELINQLTANPEQLMTHTNSPLVAGKAKTNEPTGLEKTRVISLKNLSVNP